MKWAEIRVTCHPDAEEAVGAALSGICGGVSVSEGGRDVRGWIPVDDRAEGALLSLRARMDGLDADVTRGASPRITVTYAEDSDWILGWRKFFSSFEVAGRFRIRPPWEQTPADSGNTLIDLVIQPAMAFGTGQHPTTQMMLGVLVDYPVSGQSVLDVGAGSAILSIAAAKLGARHVTAVEVDPVAEENARENISLNGVGAWVDYRSQDAADAEPASYDCVLMNIIADVIIRLTPTAFSALKPGGLLACCGIIDDRAAEVSQHLKQAGLQVIETRSQENGVLSYAEGPHDRRAALPVVRVDEDSIRGLSDDEALAHLRRAPRTFVPAEAIRQDRALFDKAKSKHMVRVLRMRDGDLVGVLDGLGNAWVGILQDASSGCASVRLLRTVPNPEHSARDVQIALPLLKGEKMDMVLQKCTEMGVSAFHIVPADRSVARMNGDIEGKLARYRAIITSAAEQSGAFTLPIIRGWDDLDSFFSLIQCPLRYIAWEEEESRSCAEMAGQTDSCMLASGPEGGLSESEVERWRQNGFVTVSLGRRVLRAETAPIALSALALCVRGRP